ncbi:MULTISPECIES: hypothetical protein [Sulfitobacter]|uniref:hypothetical protein n=1 Tax=Sulfitobacter TaxID=60136 RepID=UPI0024581A40|nr:hypothetical protein [Sulfitobacter faviae]MDH4541071.1 hypothetical protein [Sulfitobacter faviae]
MDREYYLGLEARLAVLDFYVEVTLAQVHGYGPQDAQDEALSSILRLIRTKATVSPDASKDQIDFLSEMHPMMVAAAERLSARVARRADDIRRALEE